MRQGDLFFDGRTYVHERDGGRLRVQFDAVMREMADGQWHTLEGLSRATGASEASVSARLRDARKARFGSHVIEREYVRRGLWQYRMAE
jgi:hypothetical protein